jgi:hypothetical protein
MAVAVMLVADGDGWRHVGGRREVAGDIFPLNIPEQIFCMVIFSIAVSLFGTLISQLNEIVASTARTWGGAGRGGGVGGLRGEERAGQGGPAGNSPCQSALCSPAIRPAS